VRASGSMLHAHIEPMPPPLAPPSAPPPPLDPQTPTGRPRINEGDEDENSGATWTRGIVLPSAGIRPSTGSTRASDEATDGGQTFATMPSAPPLADLKINTSVVTPEDKPIASPISTSARKKLVVDDEFIENGGPLVRGIAWYCTRVAKRPCAFFAAYCFLINTAVLVGVIIQRPDIETDFSTFVRADGFASRKHEGYLAALHEKKGKGARRLREINESFREVFYTLDDDDDESFQNNDSDREMLFVEDSSFKPGEVEDGDAARRLAGGELYMLKQLTFVYQAQDGNILSERALRDVRDFEDRLGRLQVWHDFIHTRVYRPARYLCDPGQTLVAYVWPSWNSSRANADHKFEVTFDAEGRDIFPISVVLEYMRRTDVPLHSLARYLPKDYTLNSDGTLPATPPALLRSHFIFKIQVGIFGNPMVQVRRRIAEYKQEFESMVSEAVYPLVALGSVKEDFQHIRIFYTGDSIKEYEVVRTLFMDALLAIGSLGFVLVYLGFHTGAPVLSPIFLLILLYSAPVAYVVGLMFGVNKMTIVSLLSLFLITGVGSDDLFVFVDFWEQSGRQKSTTTRLRLTHMLTHAGSACCATTFTTSMSFFANLASVLQPLREFGFFMGMCVICVFFLVILFLPPLLALREDFRARMHARKKLKAVAPEPAGPWQGDIDMCSRPPPSSGEVKALVALTSKPAAAPAITAEHTTPETQTIAEDVASGDNGPVGMSMTRKGLDIMIIFIGKSPGIVVGVTTVMIFVFAVSLSSQVEMEQGLPEIFPVQHNQNKVKTVLGQFADVEKIEDTTAGSPTESGKACNVNSSSEASDHCLFHWCEAPVLPVYGTKDASSASCWRSLTKSITGGGHDVDGVTQGAVKKDLGWGFRPCREVKVRTRLVTQPNLTSEELKANWWRMWNPAVQLMTKASVVSVPKSGPRVLATLAQENWETGVLSVQNLYQTPDAYATGFLWPEGNGTDTCEVETMCFFGTRKCELPGWLLLGELTLSTPGERLLEATQYGVNSGLEPAQQAPVAVAPPARSLTALGQVLSRYRIVITVLFGILPSQTSPLLGQLERKWNFDTDFEPTNPWAQRAMYAMCTNMPENLAVVEKKCWISAFRSWLLGLQDGRFPTRSLDKDLLVWWDLTIDGSQNIWLVNNKMKAGKFHFTADRSREMSAVAGLDYMHVWDDFVSARNHEASVTANQAFHTAALWPRAEAEKAIRESTIDTIVISAACAFLGVFIFTWDPVLAVMVVLLVLGIIAGLAFFMVVIMDWAIGPIEVISLVVFLGYSVTYSLHIAHNYSETQPDDPELLALLCNPGVSAAAATEQQETTTAIPDVPADLFDEREEEEREQRGAGAPCAASGSGLAMAGAPGGAGSGAAAIAQQQQPRLSREIAPWEMRRARANLAVRHLGGATLSSAMSTLGSSVFLLGCTLTIFVKLGAVVIAVTLFSILCALVALPAVLMLLGPPPDPVYQRVIRNFFQGLRGQSAPKSESLRTS